MKIIFTRIEKVSVFYCPGGFNYDKMSASSKLMMKMFIKMLKAKKGKTEAEQLIRWLWTGSGMP